jgi:hypothetical protein
MDSLPASYATNAESTPLDLVEFQVQEAIKMLRSLAGSTVGPGGEPQVLGPVTRQAGRWRSVTYKMHAGCDSAL